MPRLGRSETESQFMTGQGPTASSIAAGRRVCLVDPSRIFLYVVMCHWATQLGRDGKDVRTKIKSARNRIPGDVRSGWGAQAARRKRFI